MIKIAEGQERRRRRKGEGTGQPRLPFFGTMYGELYVEGARSSSLPTSLPLILSSSPSPSLFTHSLLLSRGLNPSVAPVVLICPPIFSSTVTSIIFYTIRFLFCIFAWTCVRGGGACLLAFLFSLIDFVGHRRQFLFNQHRHFSSVSLIEIWILIPLCNSGS